MYVYISIHMYTLYVYRVFMKMLTVFMMEDLGDFLVFIVHIFLHYLKF